MEFGLKIVSEMPVYFIGLDLGKAQDHSAVAVVERSEVLLGMNYVTYARERERRYRVVQLERVTLGTPYPDVVERVRRVAEQRSLAGKCTIVIDATGVGAPVLDQMRQSGLRCPIVAVILAGGDRERQGVDGWNVPKHDLVTGLRVMLENGDLRLSLKVVQTEVLIEELSDVRAKVRQDGRQSFGAWGGGQHDDLVMATALGCWRAKWKSNSMYGQGRLV